MGGHLLCGILLCGVLAFSLPSHAEPLAKDATYSGKELTQATRNLQRQINEVVKDLRSVMTEKELKIAELVNVRATPRENPALVFASIQNSQRLIDVSLGRMHVTILLVDAWALAGHLRKIDRLEGYLVAVAYDFELDKQRRLRDEPRTRPLTFGRFLGLSEEEINDIGKRDEIRRARIVGLFSNLAVLVAHELGHHVLGHPLSEAERQRKSEEELLQLEQDADNFALDLVSRLKKNPEYNLLASLPGHLLTFISAMGAENSEKVHTAAAKRVVTAFGKAIKQAEGKPGFLEDLQKSGKAELWRVIANLPKSLEKTLVRTQQGGLGPEGSPERVHFKPAGLSIQLLEQHSGNAPRTVVTMAMVSSHRYVPNVQVQIQPFTETLADYIALSKLQMKMGKRTILGTKRIGKTGFILESSGLVGNLNVHLYQRAELRGRVAYLVTAGATELEWPHVAAKLKECVHSFRVEKLVNPYLSKSRQGEKR